jgi:hypothetical protein
VVESEITVFISHAGRDRAWAEWAAGLLDDAGYQVEVDSIHWAAGEDFMFRMEAALERADVMLSLWSEAYFDTDGYAMRELRAASAAKKRIVPLRIENVTPPPFWRPLIYHDLFDLDAEQAARILLNSISGAVGTPPKAAFPGAAGPGRAARGRTPRPGGPGRLPGTLPPIWNVPPRSAAFTGRDNLLMRLRRSLREGHKAAVHALHGWGGVGKSLLAIEYAHRFAADYDLVGRCGGAAGGQRVRPGRVGGVVA